MRWTISLWGLWVWAQEWCQYESPARGLVQWRLFHLLPEGRGEVVAQSLMHLLLEDSIVRYVRYVHHLKLTYGRVGPWMIMDGEATTEGSFAFFHALGKAVERFALLLQRAPGLPPLREGLWGEVAARTLWRDTLSIASVLACSRFFHEVWLGGRVRMVLWGRLGHTIRKALPFIGQDTTALAYPWPTSPLTAQALPAQAPMTFYTRWYVRRKSWTTLLALWAYLKQLETYLCEDRQLSCQFIWSPTPEGMELWIYTSLPYATAQALEKYLHHSKKSMFSSVTGRFQAWQRESQNQYLLGHWSCVWGLPTYTEPSPQAIQRASREVKGFFSPVSP